MDRIARFHKVSPEIFREAFREGFPEYSESDLREIYQNLKLPTRATKGSAGYDFYAPFPFRLEPGQSIRIPTGIRAEMDEEWVLQLFPKSGLGFRCRLQLDNTVGIIDSDYFYSDNEGHILAKITNDSKEGKVLELAAGAGFLQGIFLRYGITAEDDAQGIRNGGFGSTS
ncbi:MAG: deoxyuridine 5'-triphosphate nucleotidohydrolase [Clostridium sp.]|jgi:dUTP pyrophosphatase|nr:deoxyuridine 5'-triphosphate nucleotidohydrolase [Clostridium sp.]